MSIRNLAINNQFHGWRLVGFCALCQGIAMGFSVYILGLYIQPMAAAFDVSPGTMGWGMGFFYLVNSLAGPVVGIWVDKGKARAVMMTGAVTFSLGFVLMGLSTQLYQAALVCVLLLAPGVCMLSVLPCATLLVQWFRKRQSFAVGIAAIGISVGGFIMPPIASHLIESEGWRASLIYLGIFIALFLLPLAWLMVIGKPRDIGQYPDGEIKENAQESVSIENREVRLKDFLATRSFWMLTGCIGLLSLCSIVLVTFIVPYARASGIGAQLSAWMISLYAISAIVGKFVLGWFGDRMSKRKIMIVIQLIATAGWAFMVVWSTTAALMASAILVGFAVGGMTPLWATLIALYFGPEAFGRVKGIMTLAMTVFLVIPGPLGGYLYDMTGSYESAFSIFWWVLPVSMFCAVMLPEQKKSS